MTLVQSFDEVYTRMAGEVGRVHIPFLRWSREWHPVLEEDEDDRITAPELLTPFIDVLREKTSIFDLTLSNGVMWGELAAFLKENITLRRLALSSMESQSREEGEYVLLAASLKTNNTLRCLVLSHVVMRPETHKTLAAALRENNTLVSLSLSYSEIRDDSCVAYAGALETNTSLRKFNISFNYIHRSGLVALGRALRTNTLESLNISWCCNDIDVASWTAFADALSTNTSLQKLAASSNAIDGKSFAILADAISQNRSSSLSYISFDDDYMTSASREALRLAVSKNENITMVGYDNPDSLAIARKNGFLKLLRTLVLLCGSDRTFSMLVQSEPLYRRIVSDIMNNMIDRHLQAHEDRHLFRSEVVPRWLERACLDRWPQTTLLIKS